MMNIVLHENKDLKTMDSLLDAVCTLFLNTNNVLIIPNLHNSIQDLDFSKFENELEARRISTIPSISIKNFLIELLENLGIQMLFSGKGLGEKAVVIDYCQRSIQSLGISTDHFKYGQTIIRNACDKKVDTFISNTEKILPILEFASQYIREQITIRNPLNYLC